MEIFILSKIKRNTQNELITELSSFWDHLPSYLKESINTIKRPVLIVPDNIGDEQILEVFEYAKENNIALAIKDSLTVKYRHILHEYSNKIPIFLSLTFSEIDSDLAEVQKFLSDKLHKKDISDKEFVFKNTINDKINIKFNGSFSVKRVIEISKFLSKRSYGLYTDRDLEISKKL